MDVWQGPKHVSVHKHENSSKRNPFLFSSKTIQFLLRPQDKQ